MIFSVLNQKGGVGKTTLTCNLASMLAFINKKVLVIDLDPQAQCCTYFGFNEPMKGASDTLLTESIKLKVNNVRDNLDLVTPGYAMFEFEMANNISATKLKDAIAELKGNYDYIFVDCPPSSGSIAVQALTACDSILIPTTPDALGLDGLNVMLSTIKKWEAFFERTYNALVIATKFKQNSKAHKSAFDDLKKRTDIEVLNSPFIESNFVAETPATGRTIIDATKQSKHLKNITLLIKEFMEKTSV